MDETLRCLRCLTCGEEVHLLPDGETLSDCLCEDEDSRQLEWQ